MREKQKIYEKGITLIALVITIIVLLILAGVTLRIVMNGGIIEKSQTAVNKYSEESAREKLSLALVEYKMGYITGGEKDLIKYIEDNNIGNVTGGEDDTEAEYIIEIDGYEFSVRKDNYEITSNGLATGEKPTINLVGEPELSTDKKKVTLTFEAKPANGGSLTVTVDGNPATLSGNVYKYEVTKNGRHIIKAKETNGRTGSLVVDITDIEVTKYTVTINKGTGIESVTASQQVEEGNSLKIEAKVQTGYVFSKWNIISGAGTIENVTNATTTVTPTVDITIEATAGAQMAKITNGNNLTGNANGTLNGKPAEYNNPVIPVGFRTSNEGASWNLSSDGTYVTGWNDGLVIEDAETGGNQFVWVPVDGTNVTYNDYHYNVGSQGSKSLEQGLPSGITSEDTQITTYGGFYIARYEAGIPKTLTSAISTANTTARDVSGTPVSKKNQVPWNYISWSKAKENAQNMYKLANTNNHVQSTLITDRMWETTMQWLEKAPSNLNVTSDSRSWGNYYDAAVTGITEYSTNYGANWTTVSSTTKGTSTSWLLKTGHTDYTKRKNIYDLAGNLWEWTNAKYNSSSSNYVERGGYCNISGTDYPAAYRKYNSDTGGYSIGFRVGLFVQ